MRHRTQNRFDAFLLIARVLGDLETGLLPSGNPTASFIHDAENRVVNET
jgi:hypothetical protein